MCIFLLLVIPGTGCYVFGIITLIRNRVKGYGATMGGLMVHTHMTITGSILIIPGLVLSGLLHWGAGIFSGIILLIFSFSIRALLDRNTPQKKSSLEPGKK